MKDSRYWMEEQLIMAINDAEGILTAEHYDGHDQWPNDHERTDDSKTQVGGTND